MILKEISNTSIVISFFRYFQKCYEYIEQGITDIYHESQICRLTKGFWVKIKTCFRYSFLGRMTEPRQKTSGFFENSLVVQFLCNLYKKCKYQTIQLFKASSTHHQAEETKTRMTFSPISMISMILIVAITTNVALSYILQKHIGLWGWLMRGLFLSMAVIGLYCRADWRSVKRSSVFMRMMGMDLEEKNNG